MVTSAEEQVARVEIVVEESLDYGLSFKLCGNCEALGGWDLKEAPNFTWSEGNVWILNTQLPVGNLEAKLVVISSNDEIFSRWEPGENRILEIPDVGVDELVRFELKYLQKENIETCIDEKEAEVLNEDQDQDEQIEQTECTADPAPLENATRESDENPSPSLTSQQNKPEDPPLLEEDTSPPPQAVKSDEIIPEARLRTETPILDPPIAKTPPPASKQELITAQQDSGSRLMTTMKEEEQSSDVANDEGEVESPPSREEEGVESPPSREEEGVESPPSREEEGVESPPSREEEGVESPPSREEEGVDEIVWLSALGFFSIPFVAWSEWSLYTTGCGLPPGPGGTLGALEGISYLTISGIASFAVFRRFRVKNKKVSVLAEIGSALLIITGVLVLISQIQNYGYIPSALPDQNCPAP